MIMEKKITVAGFGGQGVMVIGQMLGYASCKAGRNALFLPKYGPEQRGGTANCSVTISDGEIGAPVSRYVDTLIAMNQPSLEKFLGSVRPGGIILLNSSLCRWEGKRTDVRVAEIQADAIALEIGSPKVANIVVIGAYIQLSGALSEQEMLDAIEEKLGKRPELLEMNRKALRAGRERVTLRE